jgi:hypothetical protein
MSANSSSDYVDILHQKLSGLCAKYNTFYDRVGARDLKITVETGDNVIGLCDISPVESAILRYQLIPHC